MKNRKPYEGKWMAAAALGALFSLQAVCTAFGADGTWIPDGNRWKYERSDGSMAAGTWEDIDGEWYHFGSDSYMQTGWQKVGNLRYFFEDGGALAEGWSCYTGDGDEKWYYYDENGNVRIHWQEIGGKWYWFNSSGVLNLEASKTIGGRKFYFHEDGSMVENEYVGFHYFNMDGQPDEQYFITAERQDGGKISVEETVKDEIAEKINALPAGWRKKFLDDGYKFIYCPEKGYYGAVKDEETGDRYYIRHKLSKADHYLRFSEPDAIWAGFGEYMYLNMKKELRDYDFSWWVRRRSYELSEMTDIPEALYDDYQTMFGLLYADYMDEEKRPQMEVLLDDICWIFEKILDTLNEDGTRTR